MMRGLEGATVTGVGLVMGERMDEMPLPRPAVPSLLLLSFSPSVLLPPASLSRDGCRSAPVRWLLSDCRCILVPSPPSPIRCRRHLAVCPGVQPCNAPIQVKDPGTPALVAHAGPPSSPLLPFLVPLALISPPSLGRLRLSGWSWRVRRIFSSLLLSYFSLPFLTFYLTQHSPPIPPIYLTLARREPWDL